MDKLNLKRNDKYVTLSKLSIYFTWKNIQKSCKKDKFKISAPTCNEVFQLPDASYFESDIQDYFQYIIKKHETVTDNPLIMIYVNKIEKRITFKIKTGYYLKLLTRGTMKLLGSTKIKIIKDKNDENFPQLEIIAEVSIYP